MVERRWISPGECAERLKLHPKSLYRLISRRQIPAAKLGKLLRIDWQELERRLTTQAGKAK